MQVIHVALLAAAAVVLVVTASRRGARRTASARRVAYLLSGSLVVGHGVSLLPDAPTWYALGLLALTAAGLVGGAPAWLGSRLRRRAVTRSAQAPAAPVLRPTWAAAPAPGDRISPQRRQAPRYAVPEDLDEPIDAQIVEDDAGPGPIGPGPDRAVLTAAALLAVGPAGGERTRGVTYVAAHLGDYVPAERRGRPRVAATRTHPPSPEQRLRRLRIRRAYDLDAPGSGSTSHLL